MRSIYLDKKIDLNSKQIHYDFHFVALKNKADNSYDSSVRQDEIQRIPAQLLLKSKNNRQLFHNKQLTQSDKSGSSIEAKEFKHYITDSNNNRKKIGSTERDNKILIQQKISKQTFRDLSQLQKAQSFVNDIEIDWNLVKLPLTANDCLQKYSQYLSEFEKSEINSFVKIYWLGCSAKKNEFKPTQHNNGYDDSKGEYLILLHDHISYRYEILDILGKGSFGQALKVFDHKKKQIVCLKIIKNKQKFKNQAMIELNILTYIKQKDIDNTTNIVKIKDFIIFRNHVCLVFELLSLNLYEVIKNNNYNGLSLELIRRFAIQILNSLNFLYKNNIIHCDLKPENILLKVPNKSGIKIIDFGSSCFENEKLYSYIQSRYYRAPEVIFGIPYTKSIDMWSFGCILAELYLGYPIFPGENEQEQVSYFMEILGLPDQELLEKAERRKIFFKDSPPYKPLLYQNKRGKIRMPGSKDLDTILQCPNQNFVELLANCFIWNPQKRIKPIDALLHEFILEGLPSQIRVQHIQYLENENYKIEENKHQKIQKQQEKNHYVSEPEINEEKFGKRIQKNIPQLYIATNKSQNRSFSKEKEQFRKKVSSSFHSTKCSNQKHSFIFQYLPETQKNINNNKKNNYFYCGQLI